MGKIKRAARGTTPRAEAERRTRATEDPPTESFAPRGSAARRSTQIGAGPDQRQMLSADDSTLDEWLEPDEDQDLDQWLHEHGADAGVEDPDR